MIDHTNYIKLVWSTIHRHQPQRITGKLLQFNQKYGYFIYRLIYNSQLSSINVLISLYYIYRYHQNDVIATQTSDDKDKEDLHEKMVLYLIVTALILSNKSYDDQSYTLKTWLSIIDNTLSEEHLTDVSLKLDLKLINNMESYFLSCLDYKLSFTNMYYDTKFWDTLMAIPSKTTLSYKDLINPVLAASQSAPATPAANAMSKSSSTPLHIKTTATPTSCLSSPLNNCIMSSIPVANSASVSPLTPLTPYENEFNLSKRRKIQPTLKPVSYINTAAMAAAAAAAPPPPPLYYYYYYNGEYQEPAKDLFHHQQPYSNVWY